MGGFEAVDRAKEIVRGSKPSRGGWIVWGREGLQKNVGGGGGLR